MTQELVIDVYVDLICLWCLIGKHHLDRALAELAQSDPDVAVDVHWHSVQLLPDVPDQGLDFTEFYVKRLGSVEAMRQRQRQVMEATAQAGVVLNFSNIHRMPNTRLAHQMMAFASIRLPGNAFAALLERLFAGHFTQGESLGDRSTLLAIASEFTLCRAELDSWTQTGLGQPESLNVPGVPFFVFNRRVSLSGAHVSEVLLSRMRECLAQEAPSALGVWAAETRVVGNNPSFCRPDS